MNKIGAVLITCDRPIFYKKSSDSLLRACKEKQLEYVVVNDGTIELPYDPPHFIRTSGKIGVAKAKNLGIRYLLNSGCTDIFLMEDDIEITDSCVFDAYINTAKSTGIKHFNFGLHGNHNRNLDGSPNIRKTVKYPDGTEIDLYSEILGAFSYYHRSVFDEIGVMDESFYNALEHVHSTYEASLKGFTSPWRWFADIHDSEKYLKDIVPDHQQSIIRNENFQETFKNGLDNFISKNGFSVVRGYGPPEPITDEKDCLKFMKDLYRSSHIT